MMTPHFLFKFAAGLAIFSLGIVSCERSGSRNANTEILKINGSTTVNLPAAEAAEVLRTDAGLNIQIDTQGGSSGGIAMLGEKRVHIGMSSKKIGQSDRDKFSECDYHETKIGEDAVALIVSKDVWDGGVRSISKEEMQGVYEGRLTNWKDLGGADKKIVFYNKEPGRGTWEVFVKWAYGSSKNAPQVNFPEVGGNEETRNKVSSTRGALSQLSASWADGKTIFALGLEDQDGSVIEPTKENIATHTYPMSRPLYLLTDGEPTGLAKKYIDFMLSESGQEIVKKHDYLNLSDLKGVSGN